ncbi:NAD-dependent deacetylase sirtuin-7 [Truncatella angustata]|uniref:protein acetyllysine N-acetyltransferase n=1 Tax=Truncatella angustata TaxID=152316 RepID=A0A9P8UN68_9PEZI|nr:NAD-dependent deacetylase sirtuin-7 [Truncatella angustata]KAH6655769.1 NAD-dependent deacetylase sirtuin-7 [Truncatella angustata]KAH8200096.1 hypothetical protein TruAng_005717 [Truncatella angustata]
MADSAPRIAAKELHEAVDAVDQKAQILADHIRNSKHFIAFTGAGISTSAGIPDFRGPEGAWTLRAQGRQRNGPTTSTLQAIPTPAHMALVELQNRGILKYLVSQNCDGLHRKSGILPERISELHGNSNREYCEDCGKDYIRDFRAVATYEKSIHDHRTGRKCGRCGGSLHDTIINFGEALPAEAFQRASDNAYKADVCLVLGSSLTVTPANEIPETVGRRRGSKLAICNLQETPLDRLSDLRVHTSADELMTRAMGKLGIPIPAFILRRRLLVELEPNVGDRAQMMVCGVDVDDTPVTFLHSVKLEGTRRAAVEEPFIINFRGALETGLQLKLVLKFMGHYGEPDLTIVHAYNKLSDAQVWYDLAYDPRNRQWEVHAEGKTSDSVDE